MVLPGEGVPVDVSQGVLDLSVAPSGGDSGDLPIEDGDGFILDANTGKVVPVSDENDLGGVGLEANHTPVFDIASLTNDDLQLFINETGISQKPEELRKEMLAIELGLTDEQKNKISKIPGMNMTTGAVALFLMLYLKSLLEQS